MKAISHKSATLILVTGIITALTTTANATDYYIYQKGSSSTCDISTKSPDNYNRGSKYHLIGSDSSRSGAKKIGEGAGCSSF